MDLLRSISGGARGALQGRKASATAWALFLDMAGALLTPPSALRARDMALGYNENLAQRGFTAAPAPDDFVALAEKQAAEVQDHCGTLRIDHRNYQKPYYDVANPEADGTVAGELTRALRQNARLEGTRDGKAAICRYSNSDANGWPHAGANYSQHWLCAAAPLLAESDGGPTQADILTTLEGSGLTRNFSYRTAELAMSNSTLPIGHRTLMIRPYFHGLAISGHLDQPHRFGGRTHVLRLGFTFASNDAPGLMWLWAQSCDGVMGA